MNNDYYLDLRKIMMKFIKKNFWQSFTSSDIFYAHNVLNNKEAFLTFIDSFYGDSFGIQLFNNRDGFNYVHDLFTISTPELLNVTDCDSICAILVSKADLKPEDNKYLKSRGIRVKEENNLIIYRFKRGYEMTTASFKDEKEIFTYIELIDSVIRNDRKLIEEGFKLDYCAFIDVNFDTLSYNLVPRPLPYLEKPTRLKKANSQLIEEFKDKVHLADEAYLFSCYLPFSIKDSHIRPMLVYFIYPNALKHYFSYIIDEPKNYPDHLNTIIYDAFTEVGKPSSLTISTREIYSAISKTLKGMQIENKLDRNDAIKYEGIPNVLAKFYTDELLEKRLLYDNAIEILEAFKEAINSLNYLDILGNEYEDEFDAEESEEEYSDSDDTSTNLVS